MPFVSKPIVTYGFNKDAMVRAEDVVHENGRMRFRALREGVPGALEVTLNLPGRHNVQNALAAIAVATELGVPDNAIVKSLGEFHGVGRRFQRYGDIAIPGGSFTLVDDYGHHPAEMRATLDAARGAFPGRRLVLAFQPHRYTRTRDLFEDFVAVLSTVDALLLADVYAAGEPSIVAADGKALVRAVRVAGKVEPLFVKHIADMPEAIRTAARPGDVVVTMGAGSIGGVPAQVVAPQERTK
jgi:UDP-N-acetylmuramate--alanine ligase